MSLSKYRIPDCIFDKNKDFVAIKKFYRDLTNLKKQSNDIIKVYISANIDYINYMFKIISEDTLYINRTIRKIFRFISNIITQKKCKGEDCKGKACFWDDNDYCDDCTLNDPIYNRDPVNIKYNAYREDVIDKIKNLEEKEFYKWYSEIDNYSQMESYLEELEKEDLKLVSYENTCMKRFIEHIIKNIPCKNINCGVTRGFGLHDDFCDLCIKRADCGGVSKNCYFRKGVHPAITCIHNNFTKSSRVKYWVYSMNLRRPETYNIKSNQKTWFYCISCGHTTKVNINHFSSENTNFTCKYCSTATNNLCENDKCRLCFNRSFLSCKNFYLWSPFNKKKAREVRKQCHDIYLFDCPHCKHSFLSKTQKMFEYDCIFCSGQRLCGKIACDFCFPKSFASSEKSNYWSYKNPDNPWSIHISSHQKRIFICKDCKQDYIATPNNILKGAWCDCLKNKTEQKIYNWLILNFPNIKTQRQNPDCKRALSNISLKIDFRIGNVNIECDGPQHTEVVSSWQNNPDKTLIYDVYKMLYCIKNRQSMIRIDQRKVWDDKIDLEILRREINRLKNSKEPEIVYIENNQMTIVKYERHKYLFEYHLSRNTSEEEWYNIFEYWKENPDYTVDTPPQEVEVVKCNFYIENSELKL